MPEISESRNEVSQALCNKDETQKPALMMLSGWGVSPDIFDPFAALLSDRFNLHCLDIPDLISDKRLSLAERSERLLSQAPEKAYWLGWSLGGSILIDLANYAPDQMLGLVTLATNPCFESQLDWPGMNAEVFAEFKQGYQTSGQKSLQRFAALQVGGSSDSRRQLRLLKPSLLQPQAVLHDLLELLAEDRREILKQISQDKRVPLLSLFADADALVPISVLNTITDAMPLLLAKEVSGSSHLLFNDQPQLCARYITQWADALEHSDA